MGQNCTIRCDSSRRKIIRKTLFVVFLFLIARAELSAQLSAYASASYGYDQNPLSNYEKSSDQLQQNYLALSYLKDYDVSTFTFSYTGALILFNHFQDRNYLEHSASGRYSFRFRKFSEKAALPQPAVGKRASTGQQSVRQDSSSDENDAANDSPATKDSTDDDVPESTQADEDTISSEGEIPEDIDSLDTYLDLSLTVAARHDKSAYEEFDNVGGDAAASYRFISSENYFIRLTNSLGFRSYTNLGELSNIANILSVEYAPKGQKSLRYGFLFSGGIKYYTQTQYDTTRFETKYTVPVNKPGKGKGGGVIVQQSKKNILIQPQSNHTTQLSFGGYTNREWTATTIEAIVLYRLNPSSNARYLAQRSSASTMRSDSYNDYFSYQGLELEFRFTQKMPLSLQASVNVELQQKRFNVPALTIDGDETATKRRDLRSIITIMISRDFELSKVLIADVTLNVDALRNRSNDEYNDFSGKSISLAVGIGL